MSAFAGGAQIGCDEGFFKEKADVLLPEAVGFFALMARLTLRS